MQTEYSLWERYPEDEIIPTCHGLGIGFVAYSPLGRGFLTGAIHNIADLSSEDFRPLLPRFQGANFLVNLKLINEMKEISTNKQCTLAQIALAWILAQEDSILPIPGAKTVSHLEDNLGALGVILSSDEIALLNKIFPKNVAHGNKYPAEFESEG